MDTFFNQVKSNLLHREVILFGAGSRAKEFYEKYHKSLNIKYFTSNNIREIKFEDLERVELSNIRNENFFIVLCSLSKSSEETLLSCYDIVEDYITADVADKVLAANSNKKLAVFVGICHEGLIMQALNTIDFYQDDYISYFYFDRDYGAKEFKMYIKYKKMLAWTDVCFVGVRDDPTRLEFLEVLLEDYRGSIIKLPIASFWGYCPEIRMSFDYAVPEYKKKIRGVRFFTLNDININKMMEDFDDDNEILKKIEDVNYYNKNDLELVIDKEIRKLKFIDTMCDINVSDFISNNYFKKPLYSDYRHMSNHLIWYIAKQILEYLGYSIIKIRSVPEIQIMHVNEIAIYPSVINKLNFCQENFQKYHILGDEYDEYVTFGEYKMRYIKYRRALNEIKKYW